MTHQQLDTHQLDAVYSPQELFSHLEELTVLEQTELARCEDVIERGIGTFMEVGTALLEIRDSRLYREQYGTFEEYCRERWGFNRDYANKLIRATNVMENLDTASIQIPMSEAQVRPLTALTPDDQRLAWQLVTDTAPNGKVPAAHVQSVVTVLKDIQASGAVDPGTGEMLPIADAVKAAITEETYERMKRQEAYIAEKQTGRQKPKTNRAGDEYEPQGFDACQTPPYAVDPLLPYLDPDWTIWEPAAGEKLLVEAFYDSGFKSVVISDILTGQNFFDYLPDERWDCLITNPPYSLKYRWLERCYALGKPFALLLPVETLGAQTAQNQFRQYGVEVVFLDKRINFKMINIGWEGSAAQFPVAWFTWGFDIGQQMTFARLNRVDHE